MKKPALIAAIAVPVVLAYPAASWVLGQQVESALAEQYKQLEAIPYIKVVERKYERGVFASSEVVTFEVMGDMFRSIEKAQAAAADPEAAKHRTRRRWSRCASPCVRRSSTGPRPACRPSPRRSPTANWCSTGRCSRRSRS